MNIYQIYKKFIIILFLLNINYFLFSENIKFIINQPFYPNEKIIFSLNLLGINIAEMKLELKSITNFNSIPSYFIYGENYTLPTVSLIYYISNYYYAYITTNDFTTLFHEEFFNESKIYDNIIYTNLILSNSILIYSKLSNKIILITNYNYSIRNIAGILYYLRKLDYDYIIKNNIPINIDYFYLRHTKSPLFKASYCYITNNNKLMRAINIIEIGGDNRTFCLLDDEYRTPYQFIYPQFKIIGFGIIYISGNLKEFVRNQYQNQTKY